MKVSPSNNCDINEIWKRIFLERLDNVVKFAKVKPKYKLSAFRRAYNMLSTCLCCITCCSPCLAWDCCCGCFNIVCKHPFRYGCTCKVIAKTIDDTYEDTYEKYLSNLKSKDIDYTTMHSVCIEYIKSFDALISEKSVEASRKANIIREMLVYIIARYSPGFKYMMLKDSGNMDELRNIVNNELYLLYQNNYTNLRSDTMVVY